MAVLLKAVACDESTAIRAEAVRVRNECLA